MIIAISGKINSGKDTVGKIIQYLTSNYYKSNKTYNEYLLEINKRNDYPNFHNWQIVKFADALKDIVCILTGCTREQLEDADFKNSKLPDEWIRYGYADGFYKYYKNGKEETKMNNVQCDKERYELEYRTNWETAYKVHPTYRELLQYLGTDLLRNQLHGNVWVNALFSKYKKDICKNRCRKQTLGNPEQCTSEEECIGNYPNWIITDVRFPNEAKIIKDKGGVLIRVNRNLWKPKPGEVIDIKVFSNWTTVTYTHTEDEVTHYGVGNDGFKYVSDTIRKHNEHISETILDNYIFDHIIDNNSTIEDLIANVKNILTIHGIL